MLDYNMRSLFENLIELKKENYFRLAEEADYIMNNGISDSYKIEHLLDLLYDSIYDEVSSNKYIDLCFYYYRIDKDGGLFYLKLLK